jgi:F-type H+-transporting ATPase subunit b
MPQFDPTYFASQIFWLIVIFGAMYIVLARFALPRLAGLLEMREAQINGNLEKARELQKEADYMAAENRRLERETREQANAIVEGIRAEIATEVANRHAAMNTALAQRIAAAEAQIAAAQQQALDEMRAEMTTLVRASFERLTGQAPTEQSLQQALSAQLAH